MSKYFFDTYATMALLQANPNFMKYDSEKRNHSVFNVAEIAWILQRRPMKNSPTIVKKAALTVIETQPEDLIHAAKVRYESENMSMTDAIGYVMAKRLKMKFLTGDKEFKNMSNVEFVKA